MIGLSHVIDPARLLDTLARYLEWLLPGQSRALVAELARFMEHPALGWVLLVTMIFFSSLAFTVLENAMSVIFIHRVAIRRRHFLVSAILPYCYILVLSVGLLVVTLVAGGLQTIGERHLEVLGHDWSLDRLSGTLLYLLGLAGEILLLTSIYLVMPVGRLLGAPCAGGGGVRLRALGGVPPRAGLVFRHAVPVGRVYGSLTTAIVVLLSLEIAATLLLFGAQVIAAVERSGADPAPQGFHT